MLMSGKWDFKNMYIKIKKKKRLPYNLYPNTHLIGR